MLRTRTKRLVLGALFIAGWLSLSHPVAAAGTLYLAPSTATLGPGGEVALALRINPGTPINGVHAEIGYDASKLQLVSADDTGSAFPDVAEQNTETNPITLTRTSAGASNDDVLILTLRFKALAGSGNTTLTVAGNAGPNGQPINPAAQGAVISFASAAPSGGGSTGSGSQNKPTAGEAGAPSQPGQTGDNQAMPSLDDIQTKQESATQHGGGPEQGLLRRFKWLWVILGILLLFVIVWLIRRRRALLAIRASERPIDRTWGVPKSYHENPTTDELLSHTQGVQNPGPGDVVGPKSNRDDKA